MKNLTEIIIKDTGEKVLLREENFIGYGYDHHKYAKINSNLYYRAIHNQDYYILIIKDFFKQKVK